MKASELGTAEESVPADWGTWTVGQHAKVITGPFGTLLKASEYSSIGEGVPVISVGEIRGGYFQIGPHTPRVSETVTRRLPQFVLKAGDVVFGRKGSVDRSALVTCDEMGWFLGSDGISVRPTDGIHPRYLAHQFQSSPVRNWILQQATGTTMATLNQRILGAVMVPLPPTKAEQEAIAEALSDADALIEALEQLIAKKRRIKQGVMQALLTGRRRLPGFEAAWRTTPMSDLLTIAHGKSQREVEDSNGSYPILASGGQIGWAHSFLYDQPSVLIGRKGTINRPQYVDVPFWTVDTLFFSRIHSSAHAKFLYYRFCLINWMQYNEASGVPSLNARTIEAVEIVAPPLAEQQAIAQVLSDHDTEIEALQARLDKTRQLKLGMAQQLLTGRIRLV